MQRLRAALSRPMSPRSILHDGAPIGQGSGMPATDAAPQGEAQGQNLQAPAACLGPAAAPQAPYVEHHPLWEGSWRAVRPLQSARPPRSPAA